MIPLYLPEHVRAMDQRAFDRGVQSAALMDHAAWHLARGVLAVADEHGRGRYGLRVALVCGKGNNGGDGIAAARHLARRGVAATVVLVTAVDELGGDAARELAAWRSVGGRFGVVGPVGEDLSATIGAETPDGAARRTSWSSLGEALAGADVVVDCLLGTGATGEPRGIYGEAVTAINLADALVVACDLPTGVDAATGRALGEAVNADLTVTLGAHKQGLWLHPAATRAGRLVLGEIGVDDGQQLPAAHVLEPGDLPLAAPPPAPRDHKRSRGVVAIYAGSANMAGAAILCARGALAGGAGLVTIATPAPAAEKVQTAVPEAMTVPLPGDLDGILRGVRQAADGAHVLAIGPGLGLAEDTQQAVRRLVSAAERHVVLDADGINAFRDHTDLLAGSGERRDADTRLVLTPHAKELGRLAGTSGHSDPADLRSDAHAKRTEIAVEQARRFTATLVAKGPRSVVASHDGTVWINPTGGPALATGGTGDVLTGLAAALLAQRPEPASVAAAVYLHGLAGDLAAEGRAARAVTAGIVADHVGAAAAAVGS